ncbi:DUF4340 domain-containing protein [Roseiconus lacunae]|uniref:DUF4340 domain-containing protein n=1 Tax=Roseiconus lacunae TaxID=2605694 RepID=A0ABT7PHR4_9BACT|nr:DUF4340 domain-containing protein [Roseiconus lacunae]MDM4016044.1 DUF4340 domain-containing protein [Roseiconus lacunae]
MNETNKTGIFWGVALATALIAAIVVWPKTNDESEDGYGRFVGEFLFPEFKDALAASSLKIVTFNETLGELKNFEVRKDSDTGVWTIPSKGGYPADAVEQMKDAANAFVGLKVLDVPTDNPEDHSGMGVVEPKLETLDVGDEGVGRLVTFKDQSQQALASLIIGGEVKGQEGQIYVRKPGQDPVYVVALDDQPLTTDFEDWIEEDLLQLSSIDVENVEINDYSANLGLQGRVEIDQNYVVELEKDGTTWKLASLKEYDKTNPRAEPSEVEIEDGKSLNGQKMTDLANALDDLRFVDVNRKPEGISANLKADKDFASDNDSALQLAARGFIPVPLGENGEIEILSANGELTATTKDGVKYILRFGNISGTAEKSDGDDEDESESDAGGVNRYLMVTTEVDDSKFPPPDLKPIPQTIEELDALDRAEAEAAAANAPELNPTPAQPDPPAPATDANATTEDKETETSEADMTEAEADTPESPTDEEATAAAPEAEMAEEDSAADNSASGESTIESPTETADDAGETEVSGEGESTVTGEGQEPQADAADDQTETPSGEDAANEADTDQPAEDQTAAKSDAEAPTASDSESEQSAAMAEQPVAETEEEKLERLAAVQEKITKENERKLEERKEKLQQAQLQSKTLNERFADWYYVIPEATYSKLRISREELFESEDAAPAAPSFNPAAGPPGGFQGFPPGLGN